jgi:hypothetical protein
MDTYLIQLNTMYNTGEISLKEKSRLYDEYQSNGQMDSLIYSKIPIEEKAVFFVKKEVSDKDIQVQIFNTLELNLKENKSIRKNISTITTIMIIYLVLSVVGVLGVVLSTL